MSTFQLTSSAFTNNSPIPKQYTCDGEGMSPPLRIEGVPDKAKTLALVVDDPDSPAGNFTHWILYNIPPSTAEIPSESIPVNSSQGTNTFGKVGYGGPCPHQGEHHYVFNLIALDSHLDINNPDRNAIEEAMDGHVIATTRLVGLYQRSQ